MESFSSLFQANSSSRNTAFMIWVITGARSGSSLSRSSEDFLDISGRMMLTSSNFSLAFFLWELFLRWFLRPLPTSSIALRISSNTSSSNDTASLASLVNWTFVDARCMSTAAGPFGIPLPPGCSNPYLFQSTASRALVRRHPPCWYIRGTLLANLSISIGPSDEMSPPNTRPTSIWKGLPWLTDGFLVTVEAKRESIAFESPFLISRSSMGERQSIGGLRSFTVWNAETIACASSALILFGVLVSSISATSSICFAALLVTPEKLLLRNDVILLSCASLIILCRVPRWIP